MAFCKKCGNSLNENARFCGKCGEQTVRSEQARVNVGAGAAPRSTRAHHVEANAPRPTSTHLQLAVVAFGLVVAIAALSGGWWWWMSKHANPTQKVETIQGGGVAPAQPTVPSTVPAPGVPAAPAGQAPAPGTAITPTPAAPLPGAGPVPKPAPKPQAGAASGNQQRDKEILNKTNKTLDDILK